MSGIARAAVGNERPFVLRRGIAQLSDLQDGSNLSLPIGHGEVLYVNGAGSAVGGCGTASDSNPGTLANPLATITKALSLCSNDRGDFIIVLDYYQPSGETWPISVNKSLVSIVGYQSLLGGPFGNFTPWCVGVASGNYPFFDIVANNVFIQGFGLYAGSASYPCITMDDGASVVHIDSCRFNQGTYGVELASGDTGYGIAITNSWFQNGLASGGIYFNDDPAHCYIAGNHFDRLAGAAISIVQGAGTLIERNTISLATSYSAGAGITLASGVGRCCVVDNRAGIDNATGASGNNPYVDSGTTNAWLANYYGSTLTVPA